MICYSNSFYGAFVFDDIRSILNSKAVKDFGNLSRIYQAAPLRFLPNLTFSLNYFLGKRNPFSYHLLNFLIHLATCYLVFFFVSHLLALSGIGKQKKIVQHLLSLFACLLFAVHPIQTQAVSYIVQRMSLMAAFFYLLTLFLYLKLAAKYAQPSLKKIIKDKQFIFYYFISLLTQLAAFFSKENTASLPFAILLTEYLFFSQSLRKFFKRVILLWPYFLVFFFVYFYLLKINIAVSPDLTVDLPSAAQNSGISRKEYLLTQQSVIVTYIRLLFFPVNQNLDYDYPITRDFYSLQSLLPLSFLLALFFLSFWLVRKNRLLAYGIFFFFISLSIESSIIPIADVINEHRLYLPSFGFVIFVSVVYYLIYRRLCSNQFRRLFIVFGLLVLIVFSVATYRRNIVWQSDFSLWSDVLKKSPNKARAHLNMGIAYAGQNLYQEAIDELNIAIQMDEDSFEAYNNLGAVYTRLGKKEEAQKYYQIALDINPASVIARYNLAENFLSQGEKEKALMQFQKLLDIYSDFAPAYDKLGVIYFQKGDLDQAKAFFQKAISLDKNYFSSHFNLGVIYEKFNQPNLAIQEYKKVLQLNPGDKLATEKLRILEKKY